MTDYSAAHAGDSHCSRHVGTGQSRGATHAHSHAVASHNGVHSVPCAHTGGSQTVSHCGHDSLYPVWSGGHRTEQSGGTHVRALPDVHASSHTGAAQCGVHTAAHPGSSHAQLHRSTSSAGSTCAAIEPVTFGTTGADVRKMVTKIQ